MHLRALMRDSPPEAVDHGGEVTGVQQHEPVVISVMLIVPDADAALAWYKDALGATELWNLGGVAGLEVGGAPFFLHQVNPDNPTEDSPDRVGATSTRIELFVDDPDSVRERAIAAGAVAGAAMIDHEHAWGTHRQGGFRDPFGHNWSVGDRSPLARSGD
jgi:PhnB protein